MKVKLTSAKDPYKNMTGDVVQKIGSRLTIRLKNGIQVVRYIEEVSIIQHIGIV